MSRKVELSLVVALAAFVAVGCLQVKAQSYPPASGSASQESSSMGSNTDVQARVQARLQQLSSELNLTDEQKTKLKPILQSEMEQFRTIANDTSLSRDQKHAKMQDAHNTYKSQINAVLTPEQQQKLATMKEHAHENMEDKQ